MNYKIELFFDNIKNFFVTLGQKIKYGDKKKMAVIGGYVLLICIIILLSVLLARSCSNGGGYGRNNSTLIGYEQVSDKEVVMSKKAHDNALKLAKKYAEKGEYDRALGLLEQLLIQDPDDEKARDLFDKYLELKKKYATNGNGANVTLNPNISVDMDTSEFTSAMQSALDRQAAENQKALERALSEGNRQNAESQKALEKALSESQRQAAENQKALADLMEKQAAQDEAKKQAEIERKEAEKLAEAQRKLEEEKRKIAEAELAKKNAKLKAEIDAVNEQIKLGKTSLATGNLGDALAYFQAAKNLLPVSEGEPEFSASKESEMAQALFDAAEKEGINPADKTMLMSQAVSMANTAVTSNPKDPAAHNILGTDALNNKDYNKALEEFKKAVLYDPNNYLYYYNLGKTQYIMKKYSEAVQSFTTSCRLNGQFSQSRYNLGLTQLKLKNDTQALDAFRKAIDINPRYEKAYLEQARLLAKRKDYSGAVSSYKKVIEINNVNTTALMELGSTYYSSGKLALSEESYLRALSLMQPSSNYTLTCFNLSTVLFDEGKYSDAVSYAKKAFDGINEIKEDKSKANIIYNYALMLDKTGNQDSAINIYSQVLKYDPDHDKTKINLGVMYMGLNPPDAKKAKELFQSVYEKDPSNFEANNNLGSAYLELEEYKLAVKHFQNALKLDSKNNDVRYNLAKAYTKDGDYATAKTVYLDLLKADKENWEAYLELSKICLQVNDNEGAEKYLIYLQSKQPDYKKNEVQMLLDSVTR